MTDHAALLATAWNELEQSVVYCRGEPVGTVAARNPDIDALNYDQVFTGPTQHGSRRPASTSTAAGGSRHAEDRPQ